MKKPNILLVLIIIGLFKVTQAQQPDFLFEYPAPEDLFVGYGYGNDIYGSHILEVSTDNQLEDTYCFMSMYMVDNQSDERHSRILKLSKEGDLLAELNLDVMSIITKLFQHPSEPEYCLAFGGVYYQNQGYANLYLAKFDHDLNLAWQKNIELPGNESSYFDFPNAFMDSNGKIVCCVIPYEYPDFDPRQQRVYLKMTTEGEIETLYECPNLSPIGGGHGQLFEYPDGSGDYGQVVLEYETNNYVTHPFLIRLDRNLDTIDYHSLPQVIQRPNESTSVYYTGAPSVPLDEGSVLVVSEGNLAWWDGGTGGSGHVISVIRFDSNDSVANFSNAGVSEYHTKDSIKNLASGRNRLDGNGDVLYSCYGWYDPTYEFEGLQGPNGFSVIRMDYNANIVWERYYQDERQLFKPYSVTVSSDDVCYVVGTCCDSDFTNAKAFVVRFCSDGSLSVPEAETFVRPYAYYPNPAQDALHLHYSPDVKPTQIELYDLQGRLVRTQRTGLESLNLQGLSAGTYTMRVTLEGGKVFSDKVVKE